MKKPIKPVPSVWAENVALNVVKFRQRAGLSQTDLAAEAGIGINTLQRLEHAEADPFLSTLGQIAEALKVQISDLVE